LNPGAQLDAAWHKHKIADRVTNAQAMIQRPSVFAGRAQVLTSELAREESETTSAQGL